MVMSSPEIERLAQLTLPAVLADLGIGESNVPWRESWDRSAQPCQAGAMWFLEERSLSDACAFARMSIEATQALLGAMVQIRSRPALVRLLWHEHVCIYQNQPSPRPTEFIDLPDHLGDGGKLFHAVLCLSCVQHMRQLHATRRIDLSITVDTLSDIEIWMRDHRQRTGRWGLTQFYWLHRHLSGRLVRLGRLQFEAVPFGACYRVFTSGQHRVVAMPEAGLEFREDGQYVNADGVIAAMSWKAQYSEDDRFITGHAVTARGAVQQDPVRLEASDWKLRLTSRDVALAIHIPAIGPMDETSCRESLSRAVPFFGQHFPEHTIKGLMCESWLLDPQLADHLPGSNLAKFLALFHLFPQPGANDGQIYERVFGSKPVDLKTAPRDTSLRRAVLDHEINGGRWRNMRGYILPEEVAGGGRKYMDFSPE